MTVAADEQAILAAVHDYVEGWFDGDAGAWNGRCTRS